MTHRFEYSPDRWAHLPKQAEEIPGVWGHLMSFLGGARACIGYRFALFEYVSHLLLLSIDGPDQDWLRHLSLNIKE